MFYHKQNDIFNLSTECYYLATSNNAIVVINSTRPIP